MLHWINNYGASSARNDVQRWNDAFLIPLIWIESTFTDISVILTKLGLQWINLSNQWILLTLLLMKPFN